MMTPIVPKADRSTDRLNVSLGPVIMGLLLLVIALAGCGEDPSEQPDNTEEPATSYLVTPMAGAHGSLSPDTPQTVEHGESTAFTVTPDEGYRIDVIGGCGGALDGDTYTTGPITSDCTVFAAFITEEETQADSYTVTPMAGAGGSISPGTAQTVEHGESTSFTVSPDEGYRVDAVGGCDGALEDDTYTTGPITADCTVSASFITEEETQADSYTVTPSAGTNGSISPETAQTVQSGTITVFTVTPDAGYRIDSVSGCDGFLSENNYITGAITADCTVEASFVGLP